MSSPLRYTGEENLLRVKMEKHTKFIVVEGIDDVPIYDQVISSTINNQTSSTWMIVHAEGKTKIIDFLNDNSESNLFCILDKDFDFVDIADPRAIYLDRYSIENYFICDDTIRIVLAQILSCLPANLNTRFSLSQFKAEMESKLRELLKALFYYQKFSTDDSKYSWSEHFLFKPNGSWEISSENTSELFEILFDDPPPYDEINNTYNEHFSNGDCITHEFPGKMLIIGLYRYVNSQTNNIKAKVFKKHYNNEHAFKTAMSLTLHRSVSLNQIIEPVIEFIH